MRGGAGAETRGQMTMGSVRALVLRVCLGGEAASQLCLGGIEPAHLVGSLLSTARAAFLPLCVVAGADKQDRFLYQRVSSKGWCG